MWIFLIIILAAVLFAMFKLYNQQESRWQEEMGKMRVPHTAPPKAESIVADTHTHDGNDDINDTDDTNDIIMPSYATQSKATPIEPIAPIIDDELDADESSPVMPFHIYDEAPETSALNHHDNDAAETIAPELPTTPTRKRPTPNPDIHNPFQLTEVATPSFRSIRESDPMFAPTPTQSEPIDPLLPPEKLKSFAFELVDDEPPAIITLEEATRNLRKHREPIAPQAEGIANEPIETIEENNITNPTAEAVDAEPVLPTIHQTPAPDLEVITLADAMRAWQDDEYLMHAPMLEPRDIAPKDELGYDDVLSAAAVRERTLQHTPRPSPKPLPLDAETISEDEIRESLLRQRMARRQQLLAEAPVHSILRTIPEDEVFANLARSDAPAARRRRRNSTTTTVVPVAEYVPTVAPAPIAPKPVASAPIQPVRRASALGNMPYPRMRHRVTLPTPATPAVKVNPNTPAPASLTRFTQIAPNATAPTVTPNAIAPSTTASPLTAPAPLDMAPPVSITEPVIVPPSSIDAPVIMEQPMAFSSPSHSLDPFQQAPIYTEQPYYPAYKAYQEEILATEAQEYADNPPAYPLPTVSLLMPPQYDREAVQTEEQLLENGITIEEKLAEFRVKVKVIDAYAGPVITRYEIEPDTGVRGNSVLNLEKDLARSLGMASIRVVETIPGKNCMGIELPNPKRQMIRISEIFNSPAFSQSRSKLTLALGQDITGQPVVTDLAKAPHLLVAGTTGSGKSVGVNSMILSLLFKATPEDVRLIMIDPKMLELSVYEGIPHLLTPVITDMKYAANALNWCVGEMEKRYRLMSHLGVRNLAGYNAKIMEGIAQGVHYPNPFSLNPEEPEPLQKLPSIVVVVDEFADLMMVAGKKIEELIARLAQKARAAGIHLILATQRPSVDVITGLIKANIPTRIAFQVSSKVDSRTILDQMGAENLLGQGDMLFLPPGTGYPQRVHGAFVDDNEVHGIVEYLKQFGAPDYIDDILSPSGDDSGFASERGTGERDPLFDEAVATILRTQKPTISSLQRFLRIGYNKAATLFDQMEAEGIVSPADSAGKRTILARSDNVSDN